MLLSAFTISFHWHLKWSPYWWVVQNHLSILLKWSRQGTCSAKTEYHLSALTSLIFFFLRTAIQQMLERKGLPSLQNPLQIPSLNLVFFSLLQQATRNTAHAVAIESWKPKLKVIRYVTKLFVHPNCTVICCAARHVYSDLNYGVSKKSICSSLCMQRTPHHQLPLTSWPACPADRVKCDKHGRAREGQFASPITTNRLGILWPRQKRLM